MKLSQIKSLSWGGALLLTTLLGVFTFQAWGKAMSLTEPKLRPWRPAMPDTSEIGEEVLITKQSIMSALAFITKREEKIIAQPTQNTGPVIPVDEGPTGELEHEDLEVVLIAYDDRGEGHMAFIKKGFNPSHPYMIGDDMGLAPATIVDSIFRDHVILRSTDGRTQVLYIGGAKGASGDGPKTTLSPSGSPGVAPVEVVSTNAPSARGGDGVAEDGGAKPGAVSQRYVPQWRKAKMNEAYGVQVIEYSPSPDGARRFAIGDNDLKALQGQALRLLTEVAPSTAYNERGETEGIKLDFMVENPLAQAYGIQNGDVLTHLDGKKVTHEADAQAFYEGLDGKKRTVMVTVKRQNSRGESVNVNVIYEMDDFPGVQAK